ncbi:hypothetical protein E2C01_033532 [Portunus trituberculatus]|uniref:Uncharacterized protein n=1 Tax=Portunus trituberculatus TaxID=210409 RepID=A0A5B7F3Z6_PORTR|nr:hypothetical protein [Portunus trituberculatus]
MRPEEPPRKLHPEEIAGAVSCYAGEFEHSKKLCNDDSVVCSLPRNQVALEFWDVFDGFPLRAG